MLQKTVLVLSNIQRLLRRISAVLSYVTEAPTGSALLKKGVLTNFATFTGKHLCQSLFLNKVEGLFRTPPDDCLHS